MSLTIHDCLIRIEKRAERAENEKLTETFVDAAPLLASVTTTDHQVVFGRRGTGKTEPRRVCRKPVLLSYAAMAGCSSMA